MLRPQRVRPAFRVPAGQERAAAARGQRCRASGEDAVCDVHEPAAGCGIRRREAEVEPGAGCCPPGTGHAGRQPVHGASRCAGRWLRRILARGSGAGPSGQVEQASSAERPQVGEVAGRGCRHSCAERVSRAAGSEDAQDLVLEGDQLRVGRAAPAVLVEPGPAAGGGSGPCPGRSAVRHWAGCSRPARIAGSIGRYCAGLVGPG